MADRVTGDQTDNVVGKSSAYYATPTTNCCGCPEDVFVVLRFSCPSLSSLVGLCFLVLLFSFACHISGGALHLFILFLFYICFYFPVGFLYFLSCRRIWIASICMSYLSYPVRWQVIALSTLLTALQCSISVSCLCDHRACILGGRLGTDTGRAGCRRVERTV